VWLLEEDSLERLFVETAKGGADVVALWDVYDEVFVLMQQECRCNTHGECRVLGFGWRVNDDALVSRG